MNSNDLESEVIAIVKGVTKSNSVDKKTSQNDIPQWDSLAYMSILSEVEAKYQIEITQQNIQKFDSITSIIEVINAK